MEHQVKHTKPPPAIDTHTPEWEVEEVIQHRWVRGKIQYLVKWMNYPPESNSWEPKVNLKNCKDLINNYHVRTQAQKGKEGANVRGRAELEFETSRDAASPHSAIEAFAPMRRKRGRPRKAVVEPPFVPATREASGQGHGGQSAAAAAPEAPAHKWSGAGIKPTEQPLPEGSSLPLSGALASPASSQSPPANKEAGQASTPDRPHSSQSRPASPPLPHASSHVPPARTAVPPTSGPRTYAEVTQALQATLQA